MIQGTGILVLALETLYTCIVLFDWYARVACYDVFMHH
jgi:hypothetical protein